MDEEMYNFFEDGRIRYVDMDAEGWAIQASAQQCMHFLCKFHDRLRIVSMRSIGTEIWDRWEMRLEHSYTEKGVKSNGKA